MSFDISNIGDDILDVRDMIDELEALDTDDDEGEEHADIIQAILDELKGCGGDHQWRGDWYPSILIHENYFKDYARELAEDCGLIPKGVQWPCTCIDWEMAAEELEQDYASINLDKSGRAEIYYYR